MVEEVGGWMVKARLKAPSGGWIEAGAEAGQGAQTGAGAGAGAGAEQGAQGLKTEVCQSDLRKYKSIAYELCYLQNIHCRMTLSPCTYLSYCTIVQC